MKADINYTECKQNQQNMEDSKKSIKSKESKNLPTLKLPKRRSTRLKSEIFVDAFGTDLLDDKYSITKVNNSSGLEYEPLRKKIKLSKSNSKNLVNETLHSTDPVQNRILDNATKNKDQPHRGGKLHVNIEGTTDRLVESLTTSTVNKLKVSHSKIKKESKNPNYKKQRKQSECVDLSLDKVLIDKADQALSWQGKRTRRSTILLDEPPTDVNKIIRIVSSQEILDIKLNGKEKRKNLETNILDKTPKVSLTKISNNVVHDNHTLKKNVKSKEEISADISCDHKLLKGDVKASTLKRKRNSMIPKIVEPFDESLHDNIGNRDITNINNDKLNKSPLKPNKRGRKPKGLNMLEKDLETSGKNKIVLRSHNALNVNHLKEPQAIKKSNTQTRIKKNSDNMYDNFFSTKSDVNSKSKNLQPNKRGRPQSSKQCVRKLNPTKQSQGMHCTKLSKLTKKQLKNVNTRKIPKNILDDVLDMIDNDDHPVWEDRNISCNPSIHTYWQSNSSFTSDQNIKLKYARQFLLRRDWLSLSKILCLSNSKSKIYYPLLSKYAALLLAYTNKEQFNKFVQFLTSVSDSSSVLKKCTKVSKDNED